MLGRNTCPLGKHIQDHPWSHIHLYPKSNILRDKFLQPQETWLKRSTHKTANPQFGCRHRFLFLYLGRSWHFSLQISNPLPQISLLFVLIWFLAFLLDLSTNVTNQELWPYVHPFQIHFQESSNVSVSSFLDKVKAHMCVYLSFINLTNPVSTIYFQQP